MNLQFLRHATFILTMRGTTLLVDPMLSRKGALDPVANAANSQRIPLVDLPVTDTALKNLIRQLDGVLVTHTHRDHWDVRAVELLPKSLPILTQPTSEHVIREGGFLSVAAVSQNIQWHGLTIYPTRGQHGTGEIGQKMGVVSGFVLRAPDEPTLYIAGDTIWCPEVENALQVHQPDIVIVNAGAAQFITGDPITMTADDVVKVCQAAPKAQMIAVHMETVNHCWLTRDMLREHLGRAGFRRQVYIPADGEIVPLWIRQP
jgi:L-ascorbate metabolism protein UlaG (beta-lactamase superfamily)